MREKAKDLFLTDDENIIVARYKEDQATMPNGARKRRLKGRVFLIIKKSHLSF